jgi:hypothetical protein
VPSTLPGVVGLAAVATARELPPAAMLASVGCSGKSMVAAVGGGVSEPIRYSKGDGGMGVAADPLLIARRPLGLVDGVAMSAGTGGADSLDASGAVQLLAAERSQSACLAGGMVLGTGSTATGPPVTRAAARQLDMTPASATGRMLIAAITAADSPARQRASAAPSADRRMSGSLLVPKPTIALASALSPSPGARVRRQHCSLLALTPAAT